MREGVGRERMREGRGRWEEYGRGEILRGGYEGGDREVREGREGQGRERWGNGNKTEHAQHSARDTQTGIVLYVCCALYCVCVVL